MIGIVCIKCHTIHEKGTSCPNCTNANKKKYERNKRDRENQGFYKSREWVLLRRKVLDYYCGTDIWKLGLEGKLVACKRPIVHHIRPYRKFPALALNFANLICVSTDSHNEIHDYYDSGRFEKALEIIKLGKERYKEIKNGQRDTFGESTEM